MEINPRACPGNRLHKALRQIPSHGLTDQYRPSHPLPNQDPVEPLCLFHQENPANGREAPWPGASHTSRAGGMQKRRTASGTAGDPPSGPAERPARSREGRARSPSIGWSPVSSDSSAPTSPFPSLFSPPQREHAHGPPCPHGRRGAVLPHNFDRIRSSSSCFPSPFSAERELTLRNHPAPASLELSEDWTRSLFFSAYPACWPQPQRDGRCS